MYSNQLQYGIAPQPQMPAPEFAGSVLKRHMSSALASWVAVFSLCSFHWTSALVCWEIVFVLGFMLATFGFGILVLYFYAIVWIPVLIFELTTIALLCTFGIQTAYPFFTERGRPGFVAPERLKKAERLPLFRVIALGIGAVLLAVLADLCESALDWEPTAQDAGTLWDLSMYADFFFIALFGMAACIFLMIVWIFVYKYIRRLRKFAAGDGYRIDKKPPVALMCVGAAVCLMTLNLSSALYLLLSAVWYGRIHRDMRRSIEQWSLSA